MASTGVSCLGVKHGPAAGSGGAALLLLLLFC
jgi:hypothetical protein